MVFFQIISPHSHLIFYCDQNSNEKHHSYTIGHMNEAKRRTIQGNPNVNFHLGQYEENDLNRLLVRVAVHPVEIKSRSNMFVDAGYYQKITMVATWSGTFLILSEH